MALRIRQALRFGPKAELATYAFKRRYLTKVRELPALDVGGEGLDCFMLLNEARCWEGVWALYSFRHYFGPCRLIVLDDGTLKPASIGTLKRIFPGISIPNVATNDAEMDQYLERANLRLCRDWRRRFVFFRKLVDPIYLARSEQILLLDSDVLHFRHPQELSVWQMHPDVACYAADSNKHAYCETPAILERLCSASLPEYFCAGYLYLPRSAIDLTRVERYLASECFERQRIKGRFDHVAEQTLYAMEGALFGTRVLPPGYAVCPDPERDHVVMGHYCGGDIRRTWFYTKGLPYLARTLHVTST
jgi:hypothetical protein